MLRSWSNPRRCTEDGGGERGASGAGVAPCADAGGGPARDQGCQKMLGPQLHDAAAVAHVQLARTPLQISGGGGGEHSGLAHVQLAPTPSSLPTENTFYTEKNFARTPSVAPAPAVAETQERDRDLLSTVLTLIEQKGSVVIDAGRGGGDGGEGGGGGGGGRWRRRRENL